VNCRKDSQFDVVVAVVVTVFAEVRAICVFLSVGLDSVVASSSESSSVGESVVASIAKRLDSTPGTLPWGNCSPCRHTR
jgi:hypothetical protein